MFLIMYECPFSIQFSFEIESFRLFDVLCVCVTNDRFFRPSEKLHSQNQQFSYWTENNEQYHHSFPQHSIQLRFVALLVLLLYCNILCFLLWQCVHLPFSLGHKRSEPSDPVICAWWQNKSGNGLPLCTRDATPGKTEQSPSHNNDTHVTAGHMYCSHIYIQHTDPPTLHRPLFLSHCLALAGMPVDCVIENEIIGRE